MDGRQGMVDGWGMFDKSTESLRMLLGRITSVDNVESHTEIAIFLLKWLVGFKAYLWTVINCTCSATAFLKQRKIAKLCFDVSTVFHKAFLLWSPKKCDSTLRGLATVLRQHDTSLWIIKVRDTRKIWIAREFNFTDKKLQNYEPRFWALFCRHLGPRKRRQSTRWCDSRSALYTELREFRSPSRSPWGGILKLKSRDPKALTHPGGSGPCLLLKISFSEKARRSENQVPVLLRFRICSQRLSTICESWTRSTPPSHRVPCNIAISYLWSFREFKAKALQKSNREQ